MRNNLHSVICICVIFLLFDQTVFSQNVIKRSVDINGNKIYTLFGGEEHLEKGVPLIVLEAGGSGQSGTWSTIIDSLSQFAPVLAYDRAGIGRSDGDGQESTIQKTTERLHLVLNSLNVPKTYLLVSFSRGSYYIRNYAAEYPDEVAGMVFIDPSDFLATREAHEKAMEAIGAKPEDYQSLLNLDLEESKNSSPGARSEVEQMIKLHSEYSSTYFSDLSPIPKVPVVIISSSGPVNVPPPGVLPFDLQKFADAMEVTRRNNLLQFISSSPEGTFVESNYLSHAMHREDPNLSIWAIRKALYSDVVNSLFTLISKRGFEEGLKDYHQRKNWYPKGSFSEYTLNALGYKLLEIDKTDEAIVVFQLNTKEYPDAPNPHDSLGDAYRAANMTKEALEAYGTAVELASKSNHPSLSSYERKYNELKKQVKKN